MFKLYDIILTTVEEGQEPIEVPLRTKLLRNDLEKQWEIVIRLKNASSLIEETFAVRSSLLDARKDRIISPTTRLQLISTSRDTYGIYMPEFPVVYDTFDFVAGKIGQTVAACMTYNVLGTLNPTVAFLDIMSTMCKIALPLRDPVNDFLWKLSPKETGSLAQYTFQEAYHFFNLLTEKLDPDGSRYKRAMMLETASAIEQKWNVYSKDVEDDFYKLLFSPSPTTFLISEYDYYIHIFFKAKNSLEVEYGNQSILLEAIRQQLTTGRGLLCPFWAYGRGCCSSQNRELLEKVWSCTYRTSDCELWQRWGCLEQ